MAPRKVYSLRIFAFFATVVSTAGSDVKSKKPLIEKNLVVVNEGIFVPFGRSVFVDPDTDLKVQVSYGDHCTLRVIDTDPFYRQPGHLTPSSFPCRFGYREVEYTHFGARMPSSHKVKLLLRYDSKEETLIIPIVMNVHVLFEQLEIVTKNLPLTVERLGGFSNPIDGRTLQFTYDKGHHNCKVAILSNFSGLPRYGKLVNSTSEGKLQDCDIVLQSDLRYKHNPRHKSPNRDFIPMFVELTDIEEKSFKQEYFRVMIRIREGEENTPPQLSFSSLLLMDVNQFVMTAITPNVLIAEDSETPAKELVFNISVPLGNDEGMIVSTDDQQLPITFFYQKDLKDLKIAYKPPASDSSERRFFSLTLEIIDGEGLSSEPFGLTIIVNPMNSLAPITTENNGLVLFEGQSRKIRSSKNLKISDENNVEDVVISVVGGLKHGQLLQSGKPIKHFTVADLDADLVVYEHDGSNSVSDNIIFMADDGQHKIEFLFPVAIYPEDDDPPVLYINTGFSVSSGDEIEITPFILSATDIDSDDSAITFHLTRNSSVEGQLIRKQRVTPADAEKWNFVKGFYEKPVVSWTQGDIMDGKIYYRQNHRYSNSPFIDVLEFTIRDNHVPPNVSPPYELFITVTPSDEIAPHADEGSPLQMAVDEYTLTLITPESLRFLDNGTAEEDILIKITRHPFDTDKSNPIDPGKIVYFENPEASVLQFTQAEVNYHKIAYKPPSVELGLIVRLIQFDFEVSDKVGNTLSNQTFIILLRPVDNKAPVVRSSSVDVFENGFAVLTSSVLDVTDEDTVLDRIAFTIKEGPNYGVLQLGAKNLTPGDTFTKVDIARGLVTYVNNGEEADKDSVKMEVSDGVHNTVFSLAVSVKNIDDEPPVLQIVPEITGVELKVDEGGRIPLTVDMIKATDPDTDDGLITFIVQDGPKLGFIEVDGVVADRFKQRDVVDRKVFYVHNGAEIGCNIANDSFNLTVSDMSDEWVIGGNTVENVLISLSIIPVDNLAPDVQVKGAVRVKEGNISLLTLHHVNISDYDTTAETVTCYITSLPIYGFLQNGSLSLDFQKRDTGSTTEFFKIPDIAAGHVNYVQSIHKEIEPTEDRFEFYCTDGINSSPDVVQRIEIEPSNDEEPQIFLREFVVMEGGELIIGLPILNAVDMDIPRDTLSFFITRQPSHGIIASHLPTGTVPVQRFSLQQISESPNIIYQHDDSETTDDSFELTASDGVNNSTGTAVVKILPVDDETPRLAINDGLDVGVGETKTISNKVLKAKDLDSDESSITYIIRHPPVYGHLSYIGKAGDVLYNYTAGMNFTQADIENKSVVYTHSGIAGVRDSIIFDLTDGFNAFVNRHFWISVKEIDMVYPVVISTGTEVTEGGRVLISTDVLSSFDPDNPASDLGYIVNRVPEKGHLESTDFPGVPVTRFSQMDLAGNKIYYVHTSHDESTVDSFEFEVSDGHNTVYRTFPISITDVDNKKPIIKMKKLRVKEGHELLISPFELKAEDLDSKPDDILFTITQFPLHGSIVRDKNIISSSFSMSDIMRNYITYKHDGSESLKDSFSFLVTDGVHEEYFVHPDVKQSQKKPVTVYIDIIPVDDILPQITRNKGVSWLTVLENGNFGFTLNNEVLKATDRDSPDSELTYVLTNGPFHGIIVNSNFGNRSVRSFTQGDVDEMRICYVLSPLDKSTSDIFHFKIVDPGNNELLNESFHLNWAWIAFQDDGFEANEMDGHVEITILRRGYLGETAFVGVDVRNGTAVEGVDFFGHREWKVQFAPGEDKALWKMKMFDDQVFEDFEDFQLVLVKPAFVILEEPSTVLVRILDREDEPVVFFEEERFEAEEYAEDVFIPVTRGGDVSREMMVICSTADGEAKGTKPLSLQSYSDYVTRPETHASIIRFLSEETTKMCQVRIIDDSLHEDDESFSVKLTKPVGGHIGNIPVAEVVILSDFRDVPMFHFGETSIEVDESSGYVEASVLRVGPDLHRHSYVTVHSRNTKPSSAKAGLDYSSLEKGLNFSSGVTLHKVRVRVLDDTASPVVEGRERFELHLRGAINAIIGHPSVLTVHITDVTSDATRFQFNTSSIVVKEEEPNVAAEVIRSGDSRNNASVRCYTRQNSAKAGVDFEERPNIDVSDIFFAAGELRGFCSVALKDDGVYEGDEKFTLILGSPAATGSEDIADHNRNLTVTIQDDADRPVVGFEKTRYFVTEPSDSEQLKFATVYLQRSGDLSMQFEVRLHTKDGSAKSGYDYIPLFEEVHLKKNVTRHPVSVKILHDRVKEPRETFSLHLSSDKIMMAQLRNKKTVVYVEEADISASITFPAKPVVVSLRNYDDVSGAAARPVAGYPLVCVTACNSRHPLYLKTRSFCARQGISNNFTDYSWRVAAPVGQDGVGSSFTEVRTATFFTGVHDLVLDSIYFGPGSRVECVARAVSDDGDTGMESVSRTVTVSQTEGLCKPRSKGAIGAEPFTAKMRYTGSYGGEFRNHMKLSVTIPHWDGMLPLISTRSLTDFDLTLSKDASRVGIHKCSNLLDYDEIPTKYGFLSNFNENSSVAGEVEPYQFSSQLRGEAALRFYRNLDLESCLWEFVTYYDMSEIVKECGGVITTEAQVLNSIQSYVSLRVPLYVSYVFYSPISSSGWRHSDLSTELRVTFVYDTVISWKKGISAPEESQLKGYLHPTRMTIGRDGRLFVNFRTEPRFRGQFVLKHKATEAISSVYTTDHPELTFTLQLLKTESTFTQPQQEWQFYSDYAVRDYSGIYHIKLIPCTASSNIEYSNPPTCEPREPLTFEVNIHFQQVSDPVPSEYSLNTELHLVRTRELWLSEESDVLSASYEDSAFRPGDIIYGKVTVDHNQDLGRSFFVNVEKCYLCAGVDGYVPKYDPQKNEYGCAADTPLLLHSFKIIDRNTPESVIKAFHNVPFNAVLLPDDREVAVRKYSLTDRFRFSSSPLFKASYGRQWYIQCFYTVRSKKNTTKNLRKRSISPTNNVLRDTIAAVITSDSFVNRTGRENRCREVTKGRFCHPGAFSEPRGKLHWKNASVSRRNFKRSLEENTQTATEGHGTNMNPIILHYASVNEGSSGNLITSGVKTGQKTSSSNSDQTNFTIVAAAFTGLLFCISLGVLFVSKKRRVTEIPVYASTVIRYDGRSNFTVQKKYFGQCKADAEV